MEATGESLVIPQELWGVAAVEQQKRMEIDVWEDILRTKLATLVANRGNMDGMFTKGVDKFGRTEWRVATEYLLMVLELKTERLNSGHPKRLTGVMRGLGWTRNDDPMWFGKVQKRGYTKPCD